MAAATYEVGTWLKSRPDLARPDLQFLIAPFSLDPESGRTKPDAFHGFHMVAYPLRPTSRGEINIESTDVNAMPVRSEEHTSELQSLMRISYAVFCLKKKKNDNRHKTYIKRN